MTQQLLTLDSTRNFVSLRSGSSYKHFFSKTAFFQQTVEYLPSREDSDDYRISAQALHKSKL